MLLRANIILALLIAPALGAVSVFGFEPYGWFFVPILTLSGLIMLWHRLPQQAAWLGWLYGLGYFCAGISWLFISLHDYGGLSAGISALAIFLFSAFLALFPALSGWFYQRGWLRSSTGIAAGWVLQEWIRSWIFTGFPWLTVGYSQVPHAPLLGYAPIFGVLGVSLVLVWTASVFARPNRKLLLAVSLTWLVGWGLQSVVWTHPVGAPFSVSLLQGDISQDTKWRPDALTETLVDYERMVLDSHAKLTILPETAFPLLYDQIPPSYLAVLIDSVQQHGGDLLVGIPERTPEGLYYNSLMSIGSAPLQIYRKSHLVPFGEYTPLKSLFGHLLALLQVPLSDFSSGGRHQPTLKMSGQRIAGDICYEDVFGNEIIRPLPQATLLVNVTNDAWFGASNAPWQHLQMSQMRAIETGRYMLRATNTGVTAIIDPHGIVVARLPIFTRGILQGTAQGYQGATPYIHFGNYPILLLVALLLMNGLRRQRRHR